MRIFFCLLLSPPVFYCLLPSGHFRTDRSWPFRFWENWPFSRLSPEILKHHWKNPLQNRPQLNRSRKLWDENIFLSPAVSSRLLLPTAVRSFSDRPKLAISVLGKLAVLPAKPGNLETSLEKSLAESAPTKSQQKIVG